MKTFSPFFTLRRAAVWSVWLALLAPVLPAQDAPPAPVAEEPVATPPAPTADRPTTPKLEPAPEVEAPAKPSARRSQRLDHLVTVGDDAHLAADQRALNVVSVLGNAQVDGRASGNAVSVAGDTTINGRVNGNAVAVIGDIAADGEVGGNAVALFGNLALGPSATVNGNAVALFGSVSRAPGAVVRGNVFEPLGGVFGAAGLRAWFRECLALGRPLGLGEDLSLSWGVAAAFLGLYLALTLLFGRAVTRCAETLEQRPGFTILAAFLTLLATPILLVVLSPTFVGPFALLFVLFLATFFGKAAVLNWLGRRVTLPLGLGWPVLATLIGGVLVAALYVIPFFGFALWAALTTLGVGLAVQTALAAMKSDRAAKAAAVTPPAPSAPPAPVVTSASVDSSFGAPSIPPVLPAVAEPAPYVAPPPFAAQPPPLAAVRPELSALSTPRADFDIRFGALFIDFMLVTMVTSMLQLVGALPVWLVLYAAVMWKLKGTTIGGIICKLKVVRLDDREIDWSTAIVRALGCLLSMAPMGLGFLWAAFDDDKQSWHDKIAGTTVVRVPKSVSLV